MKIVVASDSFKGSISSLEIANIVEEIALKLDKSIIVEKIPIADGGEGTIEALSQVISGNIIVVDVLNPFDEPTTVSYFLSDNNTAIIEVAEVVGLPMYAFYNNPMGASTYGVGQLISHAVLSGSRKIIIGLGGSCTTDGGIGMASALGFEFFDKSSTALPYTPYGMGRTKSISSEKVSKELYDCEIIFACDVTNPIYGENGAAFIFAPQKGANDDEVKLLDNYLESFANVIKSSTNIDVQSIKGTGAAGGMSVIPLAFLNARIEPGIDYLINLIDFENKIIDADLIITGEGRLDSQSLKGKVPISIAKICKRHNKTVIALVGSVEGDMAPAYESGITSIFPINRAISSLEESISNGALNYALTITDVIKFYLKSKVVV